MTTIGKLAQAAGRYVNQQSRIEKGADAGQLTPREQAKLGKQQTRLALSTLKDVFDGGRYTKKEAAKAERRQDKLSENIYEQKHDKQSNNTPKADRRAEKLSTRIDAGIKSGEITEAEGAKLKEKLATIQEKLVEVKSDGKVTMEERKELRKLEVRLGVRIVMNKHDAQKAG